MQNNTKEHENRLDPLEWEKKKKKLTWTNVMISPFILSNPNFIIETYYINKNY